MLILDEEKTAFASLRCRRERLESDSEDDNAASYRRIDSDWRVSCSVVERGLSAMSGLERLDVHFARQRGHVQVKWYRELSSSKRREVGKIESM